MRILELRAENMLRLSVVWIKPDGSLVQITGPNGQGKTSVLRAIEMALGGAEGLAKVPVKDGKKKGRVEVKLGDKETRFIVERTFTQKDNYLKVTTPEGMKAQAPRAMLDTFLSALALDPVSFMRKPADEQYEMLRGVVKLDVDPDKLNAEHANLYDERRLAHKEALRLLTLAEAIVVSPQAPEARVDTTPLLDTLTSADRINADRSALLRLRDDFRQDRDELLYNIGLKKRAIKELESSLEQSRAALADKEQELVLTDAEIAKWVEPPPPVDTAAARAAVDEANRLNSLFETRARRKGADAIAAAAKARAVQITTRMDEIEAAITSAFGRAEMPVEGLKFGKDAKGKHLVLYRGLPLSQASDAEQLLVSTSIAAALNKELRIIRIHDGSFLDSKALAWLAKFAEEKDMQVWIERVDESGEVGFVMEDGHVRGQEQLVVDFEKAEAEAEKKVSADAATN